MLTVFWDIKGSIDIDFLENDATVNSASSSRQLLRQILFYLLKNPHVSGISETNMRI